MVQMDQRLCMRLNILMDELNAAEAKAHRAKGFTTLPDWWHWEEKGRKYVYIDCRDAGAFLVDKETGEIYNIMGYGQPDRNKKQKADLGNVYTTTGAALQPRRWNYLRY